MTERNRPVRLAFTNRQKIAIPVSEPEDPIIVGTLRDFKTRILKAMGKSDPTVEPKNYTPTLIELSN